MSFTKAELDAMRAADAEIEAGFCLTPEEIAAARDRDERAIFERACGARARAAPKSAKEAERAFQKFMKQRHKTVTDKDRERARAYYQANKQEINARRLGRYASDHEYHEYCLTYSREYYQMHKAECNVRNQKRRRERYHSDPEYAKRMKEKSKRRHKKDEDRARKDHEYYQTHRDERLAYQVAYNEAHKEEIKAYQAEYRRKQKEARNNAEVY